MSPLDYVQRTVTETVVHMTPDQIMAFAKETSTEMLSTKPMYSRLEEMVSHADINDIKYILFGIIEDKSSCKVECVINTLLEDIENAKQMSGREANLAKLKVAFSLIPDDMNPFLFNLYSYRKENKELIDLKDLHLDLLLRWKEPLDLSHDQVQKIQSLIRRRDELKTKDLPPFYYD